MYNRRWAERISLVIISVLISSILIYYFLLPSIASFLIVKTDLQPSDVIVILGGGKSERVEHVVEIYKAGYSKKIITTGDRADFPGINTTWAKLGKKQAMALGVPSDDIILVEQGTSTYEDAQYVREIMLKENYNSAIIVSEPYHMRRVSFSFNKVFKNINITIIYQPVKDSWYNTEKWWTRENELIAVNNEYIKLVYYYLKY